MTDEFGHFTGASHGVYVDAWGAGPFVIAADGRTYRFEDSDQFGPSLVKRNGDLLNDPWPSERSPFWRAHRIWRRQGRRVADDGLTCIWDEPRPMTIRHVGGRHWEVIDGGEEDGVVIKIAEDAARSSRDAVQGKK